MKDNKQNNRLPLMLMRLIALTGSLLFLFPCSLVSADAPYPSYEYTTDNYNGLVWSPDYVGNAKAAPAAYELRKIINNQNLGLDLPLNAPEDLCVDRYGNIYVLDSGNGRIVVIDCDSFMSKAIIKIGDDKGAAIDFKGALSISVSLQNRLYVCKTTEEKIYSFLIPSLLTTYYNSAQKGEYIIQEEQPGKPPEIIVKLDKVYGKPDFKGLLKENTVFKPTGAVADKTGRLYVVCENIYQGLVAIEENGNFFGFVGANRVTPNLWDLFWRNISTKAQIEKQSDFIPVEFSSVAMDSSGFLYTTSRGDKQNIMVRKFNLLGNNVLKRGTLPLNGDISPLVRNGSPGTVSSFIDVQIGANGLFSCLDSERGKIFTYTDDGNLLFVLGGYQIQKGAFKRPVAIQWVGNQILVLDKDYNEINVFSPTDYGKLLMHATELSYTGKFDRSWEVWKQVLKIHATNQTANINVGKALYKQQNYQQAMIHFRIGNQVKLYSDAYKKYRKIKMESVIPWIILSCAFAALICFAFLGYRGVKNTKNRIGNFLREAKQYRSMVEKTKTKANN